MSVENTRDDEVAIREILARFLEAFDKRDPELYAASFAEDADWENAFGHHLQGRERIRKAIAQVYPLFTDSVQTVTDTRIRFVTPDVAVTDTVRHLTKIVDGRGESVPDPAKPY